MGWLNPLRDCHFSHSDNREHQQHRRSYNSKHRRIAHRVFCILRPDNHQLQTRESAADLRNHKNLGHLSRCGLACSKPRIRSVQLRSTQLIHRHKHSHGTEIIYTFGKTPRWASTAPDAAGVYGPGECAPPSISAWDQYVTAIVTNAAGRIKYWELWNEPDQANSYCGDLATMVTMAQHAYRIIKSIDPSAMVLSPSATGRTGATWLELLHQGRRTPHLRHRRVPWLRRSPGRTHYRGRRRLSVSPQSPQSQRDCRCGTPNAAGEPIISATTLIVPPFYPSTSSCSGPGVWIACSGTPTMVTPNGDVSSTRQTISRRLE